jgi:hypothetical protein
MNGADAASPRRRLGCRALTLQVTRYHSPQQWCCHAVIIIRAFPRGVSIWLREFLVLRALAYPVAIADCRRANQLAKLGLPDQGRKTKREPRLTPICQYLPFDGG